MSFKSSILALCTKPVIYEGWKLFFQWHTDLRLGKSPRCNSVRHPCATFQMWPIKVWPVLMDGLIFCGLCSTASMTCGSVPGTITLSARNPYGFSLIIAGWTVGTVNNVGHVSDRSGLPLGMPACAKASITLRINVLPLRKLLTEASNLPDILSVLLFWSKRQK